MALRSEKNSHATTNMAEINIAMHSIIQMKLYPLIQQMPVNWLSTHASVYAAIV